MAEIMSSCYRPHEWMGVNLGKKRPLMSVDGHERWKKQKMPNQGKSHPPSTSATGLAVSVEMSPRRAMRAAMLKSRFADTILKATLLLQGGNKSDVSSLQQERPRPRLEKQPQQQLKGKARSEAQTKAAEAASRRKEQCDLKKRRERERRAARMALQKMEKSADIDQSGASIVKELEILIGLPFGTGMGYPNPKQLERLGLYTKDNCLEEDEDAIEEGEILS